MLLSALLGTLGSVSLMAQTNVYSLNAVGYINVTIPPQYSIISCPLFASPDNTLSNLLNASTGTYKGFKFFPWDTATGSYGPSDSASALKWLGGGTETLNPGQAGFIFNPGSSAVTVTFVGTVPSGALPNPLYPGFNLLSSILPTDGTLTNGLLDFNNAVSKDKAFVFSPDTQGYVTYNTKASGAWIVAPVLTNLASGFFYFNSQTTVTNSWVENFSVGQ